jgi:hypothetical protein
MKEGDTLQTTMAGWGFSLMEKEITVSGLKRCLLRDITDVTNFYNGNYGAFTWELVALKRLFQKNPTLAENWPKRGYFHDGYFGKSL